MPKLGSYTISDSRVDVTYEVVGYSTILEFMYEHERAFEVFDNKAEYMELTKKALHNYPEHATIETELTSVVKEGEDEELIKKICKDIMTTVASVVKVHGFTSMDFCTYFLDYSAGDDSRTYAWLISAKACELITSCRITTHYGEWEKLVECPLFHDSIPKAM